ncbi:MAG: endo-1,4-beta-xylanase [Crocinitomicaceae bacterium]
MKKIFILIIIGLGFTNSCQKGKTSICNVDHKRLTNCVNFYCGNVIDLNKLNSNTNYNKIAGSQFNSVTAENIMKPEFLHPSKSNYNWIEADQLADYCTSNSKRLHGHTLIWHQQLPQWMINFEGSKADWENMMKEHIFQIANHFKGKVSSWDVVNEAFNEDGTLRNSIWKKNIGSTYIEKAFQFAHEADPDAKLFYNDYSLVLNPIKRKAVLTFINSLRLKGVPIDGIGMQMHIFNGFPENIEISNAIDDIWKNGYLVHISELDISLNPLSAQMQEAPQKELERQAEKYLYIFKSFDKIPDKYKFGITIWGVGDDDSWIRSYFNRDDHPLLFDDNYQPKPAFCKLISNL